MNKKENFTNISNKIHRNKYDYSKVDYINVDTKVCIICPEHGEFWQTPYKHKNGQGCPICAKEHRCTTEKFIEKAKKVHGNKYDYSKVNYVNNHTKVCIICPEHGEFWQTPFDHIIQKHGCSKCSNNIKYSTEEFVAMAKSKHGERYSYEKVIYNGMHEKLCIICPEHGEFWQEAATHLRGCGCPICGGKIRYTTEEFIKRSKEIFGDKYDYSLTNFISTKSKVLIRCLCKNSLGEEHGIFSVTPEKHLLRHQGCPKCIGKYKTTEEFISEANIIHNNRYDYSKTEYYGGKSKVCIICPEHGEFWQEATAHLGGEGCPKCGIHKSNCEEEIYNLLKTNLDCEVVSRDKSTIKPYEIDILVPSLKIGIEYNGLLWHSTKYCKDKNQHLNKLNLCNKKNIRLIQVFEDEYYNNREIVLEKIKHIFKINYSTKPKIMARKTEIKVIKNYEAKKFLETFHIQGFANSTIYIGAFYNQELIAVMSFKHEYKNSNLWELTRFASDYNYICQGVGGKLFNYFIKNYNPEQIKSFADRRWTTDEKNNIYTKLGFEFDSYTKPDYKYYNPKIERYKRIHKFNFRKERLIKKYRNIDTKDTESNIAKKLEFYRIYDCGLIKYIWKK